MVDKVQATDTPEEPNATTAKARYEKFRIAREPFLKRARDASKLTLPYIMPPDNNTGHTPLPTPWQAVGATGVKTVSAKALMVVFPPNAPFFKLSVNSHELEQMSEEEENLKTVVELALSKVETAIVQEIEMTNDRVSAHEMLRHQLICGNILVHLDEDEGIRLFHLDRYVVKRDPMGNPLEMIVQEDVSPLVLPEEIRDKILAERGNDDKDEDISIYTWIKRDPDNGNQWTVHQEAEGETIPGSEGSYPDELLPWFALRFNPVHGQDYGHGFIEELIGDLLSLDSLSQSLVEGSSASAKVLFLVKPNGTTSINTIQNSNNGDIKEGNIDDVGVLQLQKFNDFRVVENMILKLEQRLSGHFLLNSSATRNAERVTAEEVRFMAEELEQGMGGFYSVLSVDFQQRYLRVKMHQLQKKGKLPQFPKDSIKPTIVTGLEALGRGSDRNKLINFVGTISQVFGPQNVERLINASEGVKRLATADAIDTTGLVKSMEEIQAEAQQAQQREIMSSVAPKVAGSIGEGINKQMEGQNVEEA